VTSLSGQIHAKISAIPIPMDISANRWLRRHPSRGQRRSVQVGNPASERSSATRGVGCV